MKVFKVHYNVHVDGDSFYGPMGETRHVVVDGNRDALDAIQKILKFVARSSFGPGRKADADDVTIIGVELVAKDVLR